MSIGARFGKGKVTSIEKEDDGCIIININDKHDTLSKLRVVPSADADGVFFEAYDKEGNFLIRSSFEYSDIIDELERAREMTE